MSQETQQPKLQRKSKLQRKFPKRAVPSTPNQRLLELVELTLGNGGLILSESLYFMCKFVTRKATSRHLLYNKMVEKIIETYIDDIREDDSIMQSKRDCIKHLSHMISECFDYGLLCLLSILKEGDEGELDAIISLIDKVNEKEKLNWTVDDVKKELKRLKGQTDLFTIYDILISYINPINSKEVKDLYSINEFTEKRFKYFKSILTPGSAGTKDMQKRMGHRIKYAYQHFVRVYSLMDIIYTIVVTVNDDVMRILPEGNFMVTAGEYSPDMIKKIIGLQNSQLDVRDYDRDYDRYFYQVEEQEEEEEEEEQLFSSTDLTYKEEYKKYLNNELALEDAPIEDATILDYDSLTEGLNKWADVVGMDGMAGIKQVFTKEVQEKNKAIFSIKGKFVQQLDKVIFIGCNKINLCQLITLYVYSTIFTKTVRCGPKLSLEVVSYIVTYLYPLLEISIPNCFGPDGILSKLNIPTAGYEEKLRGF